MSDQQPTPEEQASQAATGAPVSAEPVAPVATPAAAAAPETVPAAAAAAPAAPAQPLYGEMAPEGWVSPIAAQQGDASGAGRTAGGGSAGAPRNPGVPHNLGVASGAGQQAPTAAPVAPSTTPGAPVAPQGAPAPQGQKKSSSTGDKVVTIILLVLGAFAAMQFALGMLTLGAQLEIIGEALGADNLDIPSSITVIQSIGALLMLSIYAVALLWSIQRLRRGKLTFWVPLSAGVLALIALFVIATVAIVMVPELIEYSTPENVELLLDQLGQNA